jgi:diaminopimelate epimerase
MQLAYTLMHGAGNRIAVVDERHGGRQPPAARAIEGLALDGPLADFDQLMWLLPAQEPGAELAYRVFNADGSEVEQCGNGVRCVAWLVAGDDDRPLRFESPAGPIDARVVSPGRVTVDMGKPRFEPAALPFTADNTRERYEIDVDGQVVEAAALSMGNPHCVLDVDDVASAPVDTLGPALENHARFPARTNVGFMTVIARDEIDLRVWERGVGETLACGTGACAAAVVARMRGQVDDEVRVNLPGGQLVVKWRGTADDPVWLTGAAEIQSEGTIQL